MTRMGSRIFWTLALSGVFVFFISGCADSVKTDFSESTPSESVGAEKDAAVSDNNGAGESSDSEVAEEEYEVKRAGVGATGKGQYGVSSEQPMSIITVPISTYFFAKEKTVFDMQIPQAMNLYHASEGRYPESEQEFMDKIIKANMIVLPELKDGDSYFYDVPSHTLMIKTKKQG